MAAERTEKVTAGYYIPAAHKARIEQYARELSEQTGLDVGASEALRLILDRFFGTPIHSSKGMTSDQRNAA